MLHFNAPFSPGIYLLFAHQLDAVPHHAHHGACLQHLAATAGDAVLNLGEPREPRNHDLGLDVELGELVGERGNDVGEREALHALDGVDGVEAAGDVGCAEQRREDLLDGLGRGGGDAVVDGLGRDVFALNLGVGNLGSAGGAEGCACFAKPLALRFFDLGSCLSWG